MRPGRARRWSSPGCRGAREGLPRAEARRGVRRHRARERQSAGRAGASLRRAPALLVDRAPASAGPRRRRHAVGRRRHPPAARRPLAAAAAACDSACSPRRGRAWRGLATCSTISRCDSTMCAPSTWDSCPSRTRAAWRARRSIRRPTREWWNRSRETAGHPMFLLQLLARQPQLGHGRAFEVKLDDALRDRAGRLEAPARRILELASVRRGRLSGRHARLGGGARPRVVRRERSRARRRAPRAHDARALRRPRGALSRPGPRERDGEARSRSAARLPPSARRGARRHEPLGARRGEPRASPGRGGRARTRRGSRRTGRSPRGGCARVRPGRRDDPDLHAPGQPQSGGAPGPARATRRDARERGAGRRGGAGLPGRGRRSATGQAARASPPRGGSLAEERPHRAWPGDPRGGAAGDRARLSAAGRRHGLHVAAPAARALAGARVDPTRRVRGPAGSSSANRRLPCDRHVAGPGQSGPGQLVRGEGRPSRARRGRAAPAGGGPRDGGRLLGVHELRRATPAGEGSSRKWRGSRPRRAMATRAVWGP